LKQIRGKASAAANTDISPGKRGARRDDYTRGNESEVCGRLGSGFQGPRPEGQGRLEEGGSFEKDRGQKVWQEGEKIGRLFYRQGFGLRGDKFPLLATAVCIVVACPPMSCGEALIPEEVELFANRARILGTWRTIPILPP
jgi:hypothetical protein